MSSVIGGDTDLALKAAFLAAFHRMERKWEELGRPNVGQPSLDSIDRAWVAARDDSSKMKGFEDALAAWEREFNDRLDYMASVTR